MRPLLSALIIALSPLSLAAQSRVFVGGDLFADVKRFSSAGNGRGLDGVAAGGGVEGGVTVADRWRLQLGVDIGRKTTSSSPISIGVLARPTGVPVTAFRSEVTNRIVTTSVLIGYQFPLGDRARVTPLGGLSFMHVTRDYNTVGPFQRPTPVPGRGALIIRPTSLTDNVAAATVGAELSMSLNRHFAVVPELRAHAFSLSGGGASGFAIRPGIAARWMF